MADTGDERQDVKAEAVASAAAVRSAISLWQMPQPIRRALGWCAITAAVALIFGLSSLAAWWPR